MDSEDDIPLFVHRKLTDDEGDSYTAMRNGTKRVCSLLPPVIEEPNHSKRRNVSFVYK